MTMSEKLDHGSKEDMEKLWLAFSSLAKDLMGVYPTFLKTLNQAAQEEGGLQKGGKGSADATSALEELKGATKVALEKFHKKTGGAVEPFVKDSEQPQCEEELLRLAGIYVHQTKIIPSEFFGDKIEVSPESAGTTKRHFIPESGQDVDLTPEEELWNLAKRMHDNLEDNLHEMKGQFGSLFCEKFDQDEDKWFEDNIWPWDDSSRA